MSGPGLQSPEQTFCADLVRQSEEPLTGTATSAAIWLLLEYNGAWQQRATEDNDLPAAVQNHLARQTAAIPGARLLFVKQQDAARPGLRFFVVRTGELSPDLYEFELSRYEDLLALDSTAIISDTSTFAAQRSEEPLFLVCTNGKRDKCCPKYGLPVYQALQESQGARAWQSSHIGGHRYAPTTLFLPHSVNYGLFTAEQAQAAATAHERGELFDLAHYRGRTYYAPPVQAADAFLRRELNLLSLTGVRLQAAEADGNGEWRVRFELTADPETYDVLLKQRMTERPRLVSCSTPAMKAVPRYELLGINGRRPAG